MRKDRPLDLLRALHDVAVAFPHSLAQRIHLADREVVLLAYLERRSPQLAGQDVYQAFDSELRLLVAIAAKRTDRRRVGIDAVALQVAVRELVGASRVVRCADGDVHPRVGIRTGGVVDLCLERDERPVMLGAQLHPRANAMADQCAGEVLLARSYPLDGAAGHEVRDIGNGLLHGDVGFVAEAAAQLRDVHAHIGHRDAVGVRQILSDNEGANGRRPHLDGVVLLEPDDRAVRFQRGA